MVWLAGERITADRLNKEIGSKAFGHIGRTAGAIALGGLNGSYPSLTAQQLLNGMTFANNGLIVPVNGRYRISLKGYYTAGTAPWLGRAAVMLNTTALPSVATDTLTGFIQVNKADGFDHTCSVTVTRTFNAGAVLRLWLGGTGSTGGANGYDGSFLEVALEEQLE